MESLIQEQRNVSAKLYSDLGLSELATAVDAMTDTIIHYMVLLLPGITIASSVLQAACCYGFSRTLIVRRPGVVSFFPVNPLAEWHAPDVWVWGLIAALILIIMPQEATKIAGWNLGIIYSIVYLAQGVAIIEYYLRKGRIQPVIRSLIHVFILMLPPVIACAIALGVVDIWADFRKVRAPAKQA